ncbi:MAG TPA: flavoprotein [Reyranella sp.]|nr:flavoprotein [Reyranella sp.]
MRTDEVTLAHETDSNLKVNDVRRLADVAYRIGDLAAAVSSGSIRTIGMMIVTPCSTRSLREIAHGITSNLLTRAADVVWKERRKLVLVTCVTSLHAIHLRNMATLAGMGVIIAHPCRLSTIGPRSWTTSLITRSGHVLDLSTSIQAASNIGIDIACRERGSPEPLMGWLKSKEERPWRARVLSRQLRVTVEPRPRPS